jgi:hypothetical protein
MLARPPPMLNCATQPGASRLVATASHAPEILMCILMAIYLKRGHEAAPWRGLLS